MPYTSMACPPLLIVPADTPPSPPGIEYVPWQSHPSLPSVTQSSGRRHVRSFRSNDIVCNAGRRIGIQSRLFPDFQSFMQGTISTNRVSIIIRFGRFRRIADRRIPIVLEFLSKYHWRGTRRRVEVPSVESILCPPINCMASSSVHGGVV